MGWPIAGRRLWLGATKNCLNSWLVTQENVPANFRPGYQGLILIDGDFLAYSRNGKTTAVLSAEMKVIWNGK